MQLCRCKGFCVITHSKHNYFKSKAGEICEKLDSLKAEQELHVPLDHDKSRAEKKRFKCDFCDESYTKKNDLNKHKKSSHTKPQIEKLTNNQSSKQKKIKSKNKIKIKKTPKVLKKAKVQVFVDEDTERFIDDAKFLCESADDHISYGEESDSRISSSISSSDQSFLETENWEVLDLGGMSEY